MTPDPDDRDADLVADTDADAGNDDAVDDGAKIGTGATDTADDSTDDAVDEVADDDVEAEWLQEHRARLAQERASAIAAGKRKAGMAGAAMAGAMLALRDVIEGPPKDVSTIEVEASSDPIDLDSDGFEMTVGEVDVEAPPLERLEPDHHQRSGKKSPS